MSASHGLSSHWVSGMPGRRSQLAGHAATGAAAVTALFYVLSGTAGPIKLGFSLAMGVVFAAVAMVLFFFGQRQVRELVALLDLGAIIGYFIVAPSRDPHFERADRECADVRRHPAGHRSRQVRKCCHGGV